MLSMENLWSAACSGDEDALRDYYGHGGEVGRRYDRFGKSHSLIAGALRNGNTDTALYLLSAGETLQEQEVPEFLTRLLQLATAADNLVSFFNYHNKNITRGQEDMIDKLSDALHQVH